MNSCEERNCRFWDGKKCNDPDEWINRNGGEDCCRYHIDAEMKTSAFTQLQAENGQMKRALSPFVGFKTFLDALRETQNEKPLTTHDCIVSVMGSGASDYIWYGDLERAAKIFQEKPK